MVDFSVLGPFKPQEYSEKTVNAKGIRRKLMMQDGKEVVYSEKEVDLLLGLDENKSLVIHEGGITGYESIPSSYLIATEIAKMINKGWYACAGTAGRWDQLFIPGDQMRIILNELLSSNQERCNAPVHSAV